jgi:prevent-host-death family protein
MDRSISKSKFKPRSLEYFREVEKTGEPLIITDHGRPVLKIVPFAADDQTQRIKRLRNVITRYEAPAEPVAVDEWEALR